MQEYIEKIIAPRIQGDGGWIEFVSFDGTELSVILRGECSKCEKASLCMQWVEERILKECGEVVRINYRCIKPYFQNM